MKLSLIARLVLLLGALLMLPVAQAQRSTTDDGQSADTDIDATLSAIVQVRMKALPNARSSANLGPEREGSGVVIDAQGHIVTIGYVVTEAESMLASIPPAIRLRATDAPIDSAPADCMPSAAETLPA